MDLSKKFLKRVGLGLLVQKVGKTKKSRSRTLKTLQNKISRLKSKYNRLYNSSKKLKTKGERKSGEYFCDKYSNEESFLKHYNLKQVTK